MKFVLNGSVVGEDDRKSDMMIVERHGWGV